MPSNLSNYSLNADESMEFFVRLDKEELKRLVMEHLENGEYETAVFWAEKIVPLSLIKNVMQNLPDLAYFMEVILHFFQMFNFVEKLSKKKIGTRSKLEKKHL